MQRLRTGSIDLILDIQASATIGVFLALDFRSRSLPNSPFPYCRIRSIGNDFGDGKNFAPILAIDSFLLMTSDQNRISCADGHSNDIIDRF